MINVSNVYGGFISLSGTHFSQTSKHDGLNLEVAFDRKLSPELILVMDCCFTSLDNITGIRESGVSSSWRLGDLWVRMRESHGFRQVL